MESPLKRIKESPNRSPLSLNEYYHTYFLLLSIFIYNIIDQ
jgi:hypothetical protein